MMTTRATLININSEGDIACTKEDVSSLAAEVYIFVRFKFLFQCDVPLNTFSGLYDFCTLYFLFQSIGSKTKLKSGLLSFLVNCCLIG